MDFKVSVTSLRCPNMPIHKLIVFTLLINNCINYIDSKLKSEYNKNHLLIKQKSFTHSQT